MARSRARAAGGAAGLAGGDYQSSLAAWFAVQVLAETEAHPGLALPATVTYEAVRVQTGQTLDDVGVDVVDRATRERGRVVVQAKRRLEASVGPTSDLAGALAQCAQEFLSVRPGALDRYVIASPNLRGLRGGVPVLERNRMMPLEAGLDASAANAREHHVLNLLRRHLTAAWEALAGQPPTEPDLRDLLRHVWFLEIDAEPGGQGEREALDRLRVSVLSEPADDVTAWTALVRYCAQRTAGPVGADRRSLVERLSAARIGVQAPRSARRSIESLRRHTDRVRARLADHQQIPAVTRPLHLQRAVSAEIANRAQADSLLVTGPPGVGKSGALASALEELASRGVDIVVIAADSITAADEPTLRAELEIDRRLPDVLAEWPGEPAGVIAIDGLDAVRGSPREHVLSEIIRDVAASRGRWRVLVSIREYDLRYSELASVTSSRSGTRLAQIVVGPLADDDLAFLDGPAPELHRLATAPASPIAALLRVPFNLWLAAELLYGAGMPEGALSPLRSQLGLLDQFWRLRVVETGLDGNARERAALQAARAMLELRRLTVGRQALLERGIEGRALERVLSAGVMTEWRAGPAASVSRDVLAFAHHVLFDYAASRLFRDDDRALATMLSADRGLAILIRPSIVFHASHLWQSLPTADFWAAVRRFVAADGVPELAKVVPASVIAQEARRPEEISALVAALQAPDSTRSSEALLAHIVNSIVADDEARTLVVGPGAGPWLQMCAEIGPPRSPSVAQSVSRLLQLATKDAQPTPEQLSYAGQAARALLAFALRDPGHFPPLLGRAIGAVCRTVRSDLGATEAALAPLVSNAHLQAWGYLDLHWLADEIPLLAGALPDLVERLYVEAFGYQETSDEATPIGASRILAMRSNRRQDYATGLWVAAERYEPFLRAAPRQALSALDAAVRAEGRRWAYRGWREREFVFLGRRLRLRRDDSTFWDQAALGSRDARSMLDAFERVADVAAGRRAVDDRRALLAATCDAAPSAAVWRRLLLLGARYPGTWGRQLAELAIEPSLLLCGDTSEAAVRCVGALLAMFGRADRAAVERALLALPAGAPLEAEQAESIRDLVLGSVAPDRLVTSAARQRRRQLDEARASRVPEAHPGRPLPELEPATTGPVASAIAEVAVARTAVASSESVEPSQLDRLLAVLPPLRALLAPLDDPEAAEGWTELALGAATWARRAVMPTADDLMRVEALLEEASHQPYPWPSIAGAADAGISWSPSDARVPAADGLAALARHGRVNPRVRDLARDGSPAVRFQVVSHLGGLMGADRALARELAERTARDETSFEVLGALLHSLGYLLHVDAEWTLEAVTTVLGRFPDDRSSDGPRANASRLLAELAVRVGNARADLILAQLAAEPDRHSEELGAVAEQLRPYAGWHQPPDGEAQRMVRQRALRVLRAVVTAARDRADGIVARRSATPDEPWPEPDGIAWQRCMRVASEVAQQVYFGSGAYDWEQHGPWLGPGAEDIRLERFWHEGRALLAALATVGWPAVTHHLVDTLRALVRFDPLAVLALAATAVRRGNELGYQGETIAVSQVAKLVEDYLANYRSLLLESPEATEQLVDILDGFAALGWEDALRLVYRLDEIYR